MHAVEIAMATRIGDLGRVWHGHESVPVPPAEA
jgi:hypothetical protein